MTINDGHCQGSEGTDLDSWSFAFNQVGLVYRGRSRGALGPRYGGWEEETINALFPPGKLPPPHPAANKKQTKKKRMLTC